VGRPLAPVVMGKEREDQFDYSYTSSLPAAAIVAPTP
jgi:hypothetical protein